MSWDVNTYVGSTADSKNNVFVTVFGDQARLEISLPDENYILSHNGENHQIGTFTNNIDLTADLGEGASNPDWESIIETFPVGDYSRDNYDSVEINVIFLYTDNAIDEKGSTNIRLMANQGIDKINIAMEVSDIPIIFNNVEIDGAGEGYVEVNMETDLDRLITIDDGYMERGNAVRDNEEADIGVLLNKIGDILSGNCGIVPMILGDEVNAFVAINVMCEQEDLIGNVIAHELGHLGGARHERISDSTLVPFENGHAFEDFAAGYQTIMISYPCVSCSWETQWSDPDETFFGTTIYAGTEQYENNANVLMLSGPYIASFRGNIESYVLNNNIPTANAEDDQIVDEGTMERTIQVTKMRGIKHSEQIHQIELDSDGLHLLHPRLIP